MTLNHFPLSLGTLWCWGRCALLCALLWCQGVAQAQLVDLGTLGGATSQAFAIRSDGTQVVGASLNASAQNSAFVWSSGSGMVGLGFLGNGTQAEARAINASGLIAGWSHDGAIDQAVFWSGTSPTLISNTLGGSGARAFGVSDTGAVVGWARDGSTQRAFIYTDGVMYALDLATYINPQHAGLNARALGISPGGRYIVGEYEVDTGGGGTELRGFVYDRADPTQSYEFSAGGPGGAYAASDTHTVGTIRSGGTDDFAGYRSHTNPVDSDFLPALYGSPGAANALIAAGASVGTTVDSGLGQRATLWSGLSSGATVTDLNDLHGTANILRTATGVSGTTGNLRIVGTGVFGGSTHAYMYATSGMIPEPGAAALLLTLILPFSLTLLRHRQRN